MIRLLSIIALVFVCLHGVSIAASVKDIVYVGMTKKELRKLTDPQGFDFSLYETKEFRVYDNVGYGDFGARSYVGGAFCTTLKSQPNHYRYYPKYKTEFFTHRNNNPASSNSRNPLPGLPWYVFENVTKPIKCIGKTGWPRKGSNGTLKGIAWSEDEARILADPVYAEKRKKEKKIAEEKRKKEEQRKIAEKKKKEEEKKLAEKEKKEKEEQKKLKSESEDNKVVAAGSGSGFFVLKNGTVITNYHVIEGCDVNKITYKGSQSEAKVLSIDKVNDIAILKTNINPAAVFSVSNEDVSLLEDVIVAGYPLGKQISSAIKTHKGVVTALAGAGDNYSYFQTDAAINQGNSGGPIINQKGNLVGIAVQTWMEEGVQGVHFGIKSSTLKTFASANGLKFLAPNNRDLSNKELGKLITESTVYVECHMTIAKIKKMLAEMENKKAFFKEYK